MSLCLPVVLPPARFVPRGLRYVERCRERVREQQVKS